MFKRVDTGLKAELLGLSYWPVAVGTALSPGPQFSHL